ncbi:MAG TPA: MBL fold metallo-hydrolase [Candidatus Saccharimonadales bacterium]|nr:MBL fold metallo-hydrolase [Candidatus Saccharimonadales bacterium]
MKITKYPQSCLIIEHAGKRLCIDPGGLVAAKFKPQDLLPLDAILYTHEHQDHIDPDLLAALLQDKKIPVFANESTKKLLGDMVTDVVSDGQAFDAAGVKIVAKELPHCLMPEGSAGPQNTGYVIDGAFFHPGDGIELKDFQIDAAAVPIAGPDISPKDVYQFIKDIQCKTVIPIHYHFFLESPEILAEFAAMVVPGVKFVILGDGEATDI